MKSMYRKENKEQLGKGEHQLPDDIGVPEFPPVAPILPSRDLAVGHVQSCELPPVSFQ